MKSQIDALSAKIESFEIKDKQQLEVFRIEFLGSKGHIKGLYGALKDVPNEHKKEVGQLINTLRNLAEEKYNKYKDSLDSDTNTSFNYDFSRPGDINEIGSHHPISLVRKEIVDIFSRIGFSVSDGPPGKRYARHFFCPERRK
jgi:phenylalanyl-tRNA synthetase alpha chain